MKHKSKDTAGLFTKGFIVWLENMAGYRITKLSHKDLCNTQTGCDVYKLLLLDAVYGINKKAQKGMTVISILPKGVEVLNNFSEEIFLNERHLDETDALGSALQHLYSMA